MKRPILNGVLMLACLFVFIGCSSLRESHQRAVAELDQPWSEKTSPPDSAYGLIFLTLLKLFTDPDFFWH
jgi:hypothetical protein